jgi:hypothetical protein
VHRFPIPTTVGQRLRHEEGNRTEGRSPEASHQFGEQVSELKDLCSADTQLVEARREEPGKACQACRPESTRGRRGQGAAVELVTGPPPQGGIAHPLLADICLTAIDERYERWLPNPRDNTGERAQERLQSDYARGRPGFYVARYAGDFVVLVQGTLQDTERERLALA